MWCNSAPGSERRGWSAPGSLPWLSFPRCGRAGRGRTGGRWRGLSRWRRGMCRPSSISIRAGVESLKLVPLLVASSNFPAGWAGSPVDREAWIRRLSPFLIDRRPGKVDAGLGARILRGEGRRLAVRAVVSYVDWRNAGGRRPGSVSERAADVVDAGLSAVARWAVRRLELDAGGRWSLDRLADDFPAPTGRTRRISRTGSFGGWSGEWCGA